MARLEIITGPMFSGKSEEVIKRLKKPGYKNKKILVVKPSEDTRTARETFEMITKDKYLASYKNLKTKTIDNYEGLKEAVKASSPEILVIDEAQFLGLWLIDAVKEILESNSENEDFVIIVTGLYKDFLRNPFGPIPELILQTEPDEITILSAVCDKCEKRPAQSTYKIGGSRNLQKEQGDKDIYQARSRICNKLPE